MTETDLLNSIKDNPDDFAELFKIYFKPIFGYILRRTGNFDDTADIASDTFFNSDFNNLLTINQSKMNLPWFKLIGIFFIPTSIIGWLMLLGGLVYAVYIFIEIDSRSHSVSDTLINFVFKLLIIGAVYSLIAFLTSRTAKT